MKNLQKVRILIVLVIVFFICVACNGGDKPIQQETVLGKWIVTNEQVDMKKFTNKYGQIHVLEAMRIQQHFSEGVIIELLPDGTINLGSLSAKYTLQNQDGFNYINIIGESSESSHPIELKDEKLQLSLFVLKRAI